MGPANWPDWPCGVAANTLTGVLSQDETLIVQTNGPQRSTVLFIETFRRQYECPVRIESFEREILAGSVSYNRSLDVSRSAMQFCVKIFEIPFSLLRLTTVSP